MDAALPIVHPRIRVRTSSTAHQRALRGLDRLTALPPAAWLLLPTLAAWPTWRWMAARHGDGSDSPWGLLALALLLALVWREREGFSRAPRPVPLLAAGLLALAAAALPVPPLARATLAVGAVVAVLLALRSSRQPLLALAGLALLSLPLIASLQFYAGWWLRLITAEASRGLLAVLDVEATRSGTALEVEGRLVIVDAPCAGVEMGWAAYCAACAAGAWLRLPDRGFVRRLPAVGAIVLAGNVVRNTVLVYGETRGGGLDPLQHEFVGLAVFALVCTAVLARVSREVRHGRA